VKEIKLTQGKVALVDDLDFDLVAPFTWCAAQEKEGYFTAVTRIPIKNGKQRQKTIKMHRLLMDAYLYDGLIIDHINGNPLDNQRCNLRICTKAQNVMNSKIPKRNASGFKGVSFCSRMKKWKTGIMVNSKSIHLGYFNDKMQAAQAYNEAAKKYFGEFAKLNQL